VKEEQQQQQASNLFVILSSALVHDGNRKKQQVRSRIVSRPVLNIFLLFVCEYFGVVKRQW
jgi:hypothetical protein